MNEVFNQEFSEIIPDGASGNQAYFGIFYQDRRGLFKRLTQAEGNEVANNPETVERNTIGMTSSKTEVRSFSEQLSKNILIEKGDPNYKFFKEFDDNKWTGRNAMLRMLFVDFMENEPDGNGKQKYKAYSYNATVSVTTRNYTDGTISVDFNQGSERNDGVAEYDADTESAVFTPSSDITIAGISLSETAFTIAENEEKWVSVDFAPMGSPGTFEFTDNREEHDPVIVTLEKRRASLVITGKLEGTAIITVTSSSNPLITATIQVTVEAVAAPNPSIPVAGITLDQNTLTMDEGDTEQLTATVVPLNATNQNVIWLSSDEGVAVVVDGLIKAVAAGNCAITAKTADGNYTAVCSVTVNAV